MAKIVAECACTECSWGPVERDATNQNNPEARLRTKAERHEEMTDESDVWDEGHTVKVQLKQ